MADIKLIFLPKLILFLNHIVNGSIYHNQMLTNEYTYTVPQSAFIVGVEKISEFIGARNLRFGPKNVLYFDAKLLNNGATIGCSQIYKIPLFDGDSMATFSSYKPMDFVERVTSGFGNAEQFAYLQEDDLFLYSGFINRIKKNKTSSHFLREDIAWDDEQCGASMLNKLALENWSLDTPEYEMFEYLNPQNEVLIADLKNSHKLPMNQLTENDCFDGYPVYSVQKNLIYYISKFSGNAQIWSMNIDGSNKKQITFMENMEFLRPQLSADSTLILSECIPLKIQNFANNLTKMHLLENDFYNRTFTNICITNLSMVDDTGKFATKKINFTLRNLAHKDISVEFMYQFSSPVFVPLSTKTNETAEAENDGKYINKQKFIFSAKMMEKKEEKQHSRTLLRGNTALYMCNEDGTELEQIVAPRIKNSNPCFDGSVSGKQRIAWTSVDQIEMGTMNIRDISHIYMGDWVGETLLKSGDGDAELIHNILRLKIGGKNNASAIRPRIRNLNAGNGALSILYEQVSNAGDGESSVRRLQLAKNDIDKFFAGKLHPSQIFQHTLQISSPLESISHITRFSASPRCSNEFGLPATSGDESMFIAYASSLRSQNDCPGKIVDTDDIAAISGTKFLNANKDIYKYNALGQKLHSLVRRNGFNGEPAIYYHHPMNCTMVFTSTSQVNESESAVSSLSDASNDVDLWLIKNVCGERQSKPILLLRRDGYDGEAAFSPDGKSIAFVGSLMEHRQKLTNKCFKSSLLLELVKTEIFIINVDGTGLRQLTSLSARSLSPVFMPIGKRIVFSSNFETGQSGSSLYIMNTDGTGLKRLFSSISTQTIEAYPTVVEYDSSRKYPDYSSNGARSLCLIAWSSNRDEQKQISQQQNSSMKEGITMTKNNINQINLFIGTMQC